MTATCITIFLQESDNKRQQATAHEGQATRERNRWVRIWRWCSCCGSVCLRLYSLVDEFLFFSTPLDPATLVWLALLASLPTLSPLSLIWGEEGGVVSSAMLWEGRRRRKPWKMTGAQSGNISKLTFKDCKNKNGLLIRCIKRSKYQLTALSDRINVKGLLSNGVVEKRKDWKKGIAL